MRAARRRGKASPGLAPVLPPGDRSTMHSRPSTPAVRPPQEPPPAPTGSVVDLATLLSGRRVVVLTGAGCSTASGIPDYRGPEGTLRRRAPVQYGEFVRSPEARVRYWARSSVGWPRFSASRPNRAHTALARLEDAGVVAGVITQNVDGLHGAAGSRRVVELHGSLSFVRCLACDARTTRAEFQDRLLVENAAWWDGLGGHTGRGGAAAAPDGDAELPAAALAGFHVPACASCGGTLKPDVVFFGENVPRATVEEAWSLFGEAEALLVAGSSRAVFSGRRFVYRARETGIPVAVVNRGPTRADAVAAARLEEDVGAGLSGLAELLGAD